MQQKFKVGDRVVILRVPGLRIFWKCLGNITQIHYGYTRGICYDVLLDGKTKDDSSIYFSADELLAIPKKATTDQIEALRSLLGSNLV